MKLLTRFWLEFSVSRPPDADSIILDGGPYYFGVTAYSYEDALLILRQNLTIPADAELVRVTEDVDISSLDVRHILPNIPVSPSWRGIWYPSGYQVHKLY